MYGIDQKQINNLKKGINICCNNTKLKTPPNIVTNNMDLIFKNNKFDFVLLSVPSSCADQPILQIFKYIKNKPILINCVKGFDKKN